MNKSKRFGDTERKGFGKPGGNNFKKFTRDKTRRHEYGSGGRSETTLHQTVCSKCGEICEVPFKPTGSKPVYCRKCFQKPEGPADRRPGRFGRNAPREAPAFGSPKTDLEQINKKLDRILRILEAE